MDYLRQMSGFKFAIGAVMWLAASVALAGPPRIDILGLVPGVSSPEQFRKASNGNDKGDSIEIELGGHKIPCDAEFLDDKLAKMTCFTGINESNIDTHADLVKGFTKKFGKPDTSASMPYQKGLGGGFVVEWRDKRGNTLTLFSHSLTVERTNMGMVLIQSVASIKEAAKEKSRIDAQRKF